MKVKVTAAGPMPPVGLGNDAQVGNPPSNHAQSAALVCSCVDRGAPALVVRMLAGSKPVTQGSMPCVTVTAVWPLMMTVAWRIIPVVFASVLT